jgi:hypothetical protein
MRTLTVGQVAAARAFLGWSQRDLSEASDLPFEAVRDFERAEQSITINIEAIRKAFHQAGVDFLRHGDRVSVTVVIPSQAQ